MFNIFKKTKIFIPLFIFCLALFLRSYNLESIYVFNLDEEYQATYAWTQVVDFHPIWIGVVAAAIEFYLGPFFTYLTAILLKISNGDPLITAYFAAISGSIVSVVIFFTGRFFFNSIVGFTASLLYATLPLFVFFDQKYWNPMFNLLIILLMFASIILAKKSKWWWIVFSLLVGFIFELHLSTLPLALIGAYYFIKGKYWKDIKLLSLCMIIFLALYWPLIIFDLNHNFSNLTFFMKLKDKVSNSQLTINPLSKSQSLFDSMGRILYLKPSTPNADEINFGCTSLSGATGHQVIDKFTKRTYSPILLSLIPLSLILFFFVKNVRNKNFPIRLLILFVIVSCISFLFYPGGSFEYYSLGFLMLFLFIPGLTIDVRNYIHKIILFSSVILISTLGIYTILTSSDEFSLGPKKLLINKVMHIVGNNPFSIEGRGICHDYEGWRYLFKIYGRVPSQSYTDNILGWLYPEEISKQPPAYTVILSEDRIPLNEDLSNLQSIKEGGYRAYIKKN